MRLNPVLDELLSTKVVPSGDGTVPLRANINRVEGELIYNAVLDVKPKFSVEVGCAYGISALFATQAMSELGSEFHHIIVDPKQKTIFDDLGIRNLERAGYAESCRFIKEGSEFALPKLCEQGTRIQFAIIDGWHTFDHVLIDFFYINRMLDVGGVLVFDDANWPAIRRLLDFILTYPAYESYSSTPSKRGLRSRLKRLDFSPAWPSMLAIRKRAEDERPYNWHAPF